MRNSVAKLGYPFRYFVDGRKIISVFRSFCRLLGIASLCIILFTQASFALSLDVYPGDDTSFYYPTIKVSASDGVTSVSRTLTHGECSFMGVFATRVCARMATPRAEKFPGDDGYDLKEPEKNAAGDNYGNRTGIEGNPRVQLCAYEDPCDGNDPPSGKCFSDLSSPYHEKTPRSMVMSVETAALMGSVVTGMAAVMGMPGMGAIAAGIGALVVAIMETYNHIVIKDLGCVDLPIAPLPPEWCHNCWNVLYQPNPTITLSENASFLEPSVDLKICKNKNDETQIESCENKDAVESNVFSLIPNYQTKVMKDSLPLFEHCNTVDTASDNRTFCAKIDVNRPHKICVYKRTVSGDVLLNCLDRPMPMPKPTISMDVRLVTNGMVYLEYPGYDQIQLVEDPMIADGNPMTSPDLSWRGHCGYLQQYEFCLKRPCKVTAADGTCAELDMRLCVEGYQSPYGVVVNTQTQAVITGMPNIKDISLSNTFVYKPPHCFQRDDATMRCLNYAPVKGDRINGGVCCSQTLNQEEPLYYDLCKSIPLPYENEAGKCLQYVRNVAPFAANSLPDPYVVDMSPIEPQCTTNYSAVKNPETACRPKQMMRPLNPQETGMCLNIPPVSIFAKNGPARGEYLVPDGCSRLQVRMWGGGGAGTAVSKGDSATREYTGGSGAYAKVDIVATPGSYINYEVGGGSNRKYPGHYLYYTPKKILEVAEEDGVSSTIVRQGADAIGGHTSISHWGKQQTGGLITVGGGGGRAPSDPIFASEPGRNGNGGVLVKDNIPWKWYNDPCKTGIENINGPCYVHPESRPGFSGESNGSGSRGPGGGNVPDKCLNESDEYLNTNQCVGAHVPGGILSRFDLLYPSTWLLCSKENGADNRPVSRAESGAVPEEPKNLPEKQWPFMWPGAGGCSYDDKNRWGDGAHGRIEFKCIGITAVAGKQAPCLAVGSVWTKQLNPADDQFVYFECDLPFTVDGRSAPPAACVPRSVPANMMDGAVERQFEGSPLCNNGKWNY